MHQHPTSKAWTALWILMLPAFGGCTSGAGFAPVSDSVPGTSHGSSAASAPASGGNSQGGSQSPASSGAAEEADEESSASQPAQVTGMYLTLGCGPATDADGIPVATGKKAYGCRLLEFSGARYLGQVAVQSVGVTFTNSASLSLTPVVAPASSSWQWLFPVDSNKTGEITSFTSTGTVGVTAQPFNLAEAVKPTGINACIPMSISASYDNQLAAQMDAATALIPGNGLPPLQIYSGTSFMPGDVLRYTTGATARISVPEVQGGAIVLTQPCPSMWRIYFKDAAGNLLTGGSFAPDVVSFTGGETVPTGAQSAYLGFYEPTPTQYPDNEGMPGISTPAGSTNGCNFDFTLTRAQCS